MENLDKIYVVHTQYYEDYNMEASSWDEGYYKFKGGDTYFLFGFDKMATAVAFVHKELCYNTEFPHSWKEYSYDDASALYGKYLEHGNEDVKKIDLPRWIEVNEDRGTSQSEDIKRRRSK